MFLLSAWGEKKLKLYFSEFKPETILYLVSVVSFFIHKLKLTVTLQFQELFFTSLS